MSDFDELLKKTSHARNEPTLNEIDLLQKQFLEASYMGGTLVKYFRIMDVDVTKISSEKWTYRDPVELHIVYDKRPKVSLLKRLHWYREDSDIQPAIMYVPSKVNGESFLARRGDLIEVHSTVNVNEVDSRFMVSEVRTDIVSLMWICNVVPWRAQEDAPTETLNNKWLNI